MQQKIPIVCLMGPTGSGKTALILECAKRLPCVIVSVDSAMVYRGMDIGTAKPTLAERAIAPHRLIDLCDPKENYSVGQFRQDALREIAAIIEQQKVPVLVGGTMLYFHALQQGLDDLPQRDAAVRAEIAQEALQQGWPKMHAHLAVVDSVAAARIHPNDPQRIARALEVYRISGKALTSWLQQATAVASPYHFVNLAVVPTEREWLHRRIEQRFNEMLDQGFIAEVEKLYARGDLHADLPALRAVGYRQIWTYLKGGSTYATMREQGIIATRQLAKRQMTWLRGRWGDLTYIEAESLILVECVLKALETNNPHILLS